MLKLASSILLADYVAFLSTLVEQDVVLERSIGQGITNSQLGTETFNPTALNLSVSPSSVKPLDETPALVDILTAAS